VTFPFLFAALAAYYCFLLLGFFVGIFLQPRGRYTEPRFLSVIVAARNEEHRLPTLLEALSAQRYSRFEVVVADDRSTDGTAALLNEYAEHEPRLRSVRVDWETPTLVGKKGALAAAIAASKGELLVFTDADCRPGPDWLAEVNAAFTPGVDFVAGYSPLLDPALNTERGLKNLERASIFAVTAGSFGLGWPLTCTARNMAYRRALYDRVDGFAGIGRIRSGDDDLMLQKMSPRRMRFLFSAAACVPALDTSGLLAQAQVEARRGSKWRYYPPVVKLLTLAVLLFYVALVAAFCMAVVGALPWAWFLLPLLAKTVSELLLLGGFLLKVRRIRLITWYPVAASLYIPYFIYFGLRGTLGRYRWRG